MFRSFFGVKNKPIINKDFIEIETKVSIISVIFVSIIKIKLRVVKPLVHGSTTLF